MQVFATSSVIDKLLLLCFKNNTSFYVSKCIYINYAITSRLV